MGKLFQEAGYGTGAHSSRLSDASSGGQNQTDSTRGILHLFRSKGEGGSQSALFTWFVPQVVSLGAAPMLQSHSCLLIQV